MEEFKGVKLSDKYDFDPDKIKYAYEPPKAGTGKGGAKGVSNNNHTATHKNADHAHHVDDEHEADDDDEEEMNIDEIKRKILKVGFI